MPKILLECSFLCEHPNLNTGIQRVLKNIAHNLIPLCKEKGFQLCLVTLADGGVKEVPFAILTNQGYQPVLSTAAKTRSFLRRAYVSWRNGYVKTKHIIYKHVPVPQIRRFLFPMEGNRGLDYYIQTLAIDPARKILFQHVPRTKIETNLASNGDILILMDGSWHMKVWPGVDELISRGITVWAVIYDIIPITHPQYCDRLHAKVFKRWIDDSIKYVNGYMSISQTVQNELKLYLQSEYGNKVLKTKKFDFFYLGFDFQPTNDVQISIRGKIRKMLEKTTYLMVSTLEPRKNHSCLIDAFEKVWSEGLDVNLCLIGRIGWKTDELINRIYSHKEWNRRLYWWHDANDRELNLCYEKAKALITPSKVEGFGLPIVEGLAKGLPVIASSIPAHREIGGARVHYFDPNSPNQLANIISSIEKEGRHLHAHPPRYKWLSWQESAKILLDKVTNG